MPKNNNNKTTSTAIINFFYIFFLLSSYILDTVSPFLIPSPLIIDVALQINERTVRYAKLAETVTLAR